MLSAAALTVLLQIPQVPEPPPLSPGTDYDEAIPTAREVLGHDVREEVTPPEGLVRYLRALAEAAPERTRFVEYGRSWEGRPLVALVIGSADRMDRLDDVKADLRRLAHPGDLSPQEADALVRELPVVTALVHGVHGNEISSAGAALAEAYHLLAARNDPDVDLVLRESLVIVDPAQNPDGRARFVQQNVMARGPWPSPHPEAAEHDEPWPGGRVNHYLFDLNRDWFAQSQPETRGRVALFLEYQPHVVADIHEMGGNSTYYFPPNAVPGNPHTTEEQWEALRTLGAAMAERFDARGFRYFNRDVYDAFYPGYGVSWPMAQGAVGMTFEQASARGLVYRRDDDSLLTYGEGVVHHFTAALATAVSAARHREELLRDFLAFRSGGAVAEGGPGAWVLHSTHDPAMAARLARTLVRNGIDVLRAEEAVQAGGRSLPAGETWLVPLDQPAGHLARNLLDPHTPMDSGFVERQVERRSRRLRDEIYDVTAWSLPLLWDVEAIGMPRLPGVRTTSVEAGPEGDWAVPPAPYRGETLGGPAPAGGDLADGGGNGSAAARGGTADPGPVAAPEAAVGWLMPWGTATAATVAELLRQGVAVDAIGGPFVLEGRSWPMGTALVRVGESAVAEAVGRAGARHGVEPVPVDGTFVEEGTSAGSNSTRTLRLPRVLLAWDDPAQTYSAGWARYVLERRYGVPVTPVRARALGGVDLAEFDVVVLPEGDYRSALDDPDVRRLRDWMAVTGGTLVTMGESTRWATRQDVGLLDTWAERRGGGPAGTGAGEPAEPPAQPIDYLEAITPAEEPPEETPGAIVHVDLQETHWLSAGTDGRVGALVEGDRIFHPIALDRGTNVGIYAPLEDLVAGGIVWEDARPQLARKAFLVHQPVGRGQVIAFAEDPNYRAYAEATALLFVNAVLLGPGR